MKSPTNSIWSQLPIKAICVMSVLAWLGTPWPIVVVGVVWIFQTPLESVLRRSKSFEVSAASWTFNGELESPDRQLEPYKPPDPTDGNGENIA